MREFKLKNEGGTTQREYALQYTDAFLWQPAGLGFSYDREYREVDGFFLTMASAISQTAKTGIIVFKGQDPYTDYKKFIDWIMASQRLTLMYSPKGTWYYMDINVEEVQKSEIEQDGTLQCSITMMPTSPIYLKESQGFEISGELPTNIKKYTYGYKPDLSVYDSYLGNSSTPITNGGAEAPTINGVVISPNAGDYVTYGGILYFCDGMNWATAVSDEGEFWYTYSNTAVAGELVINAEAQLPCGIEIYTKTPVSAPVLSFYDGTELIGLVDLSAVSVASGEELLYSGLPTSAGVTLISGGVKTDISNLMGISAQAPAYFMIPPNKDITVVLSADSLRGVDIELRVYRYFASI